MKTIAYAAMAAAFALTACDSAPDADDAVATETAAAGADTTVVVPAATETTVVTTPGETSTSTGDRVSVGPNGVSADVGNGDTRVRVNTDDPTLTVEKH